MDKGALACPFHHHLALTGDWTVAMVDGVPYWIPAPWVDPDRPRLHSTYFQPTVAIEPPVPSPSSPGASPYRPTR